MISVTKVTTCPPRNHNPDILSAWPIVKHCDRGKTSRDFPYEIRILIASTVIGDFRDAMGKARIIVRQRVYLMASLYLIAFGGLLAGLAFFQVLPTGMGLAVGGLLALSTVAFTGAAIGLSRAFGK
jgi:hypothetical protein